MRARYRVSIALAVANFLLASTAHANAFIPTMMSANLLWVVILLPVVAIEGALMKKWGWAAPYRSALGGNTLTMLIALPFGLLLSFLGAACGEWGKAANPGVAQQLLYFLAQVFLYGSAPTPTYGFAGSQSFSDLLGMLLASLLFVGCCWIFTIYFEANFYARRNKNLESKYILRKTIFMHVISYGVLMALWIPISIYSAKKSHDYQTEVCARFNVSFEPCVQIWKQYPEVKARRLSECISGGVDQQDCFVRSQSGSSSKPR